jgi:hypothetical protein
MKIMKTRKKENKKRQEKGAILPLVLIYSTFFLVIFIGLINYIAYQRTLSVKKEYREVSFNVAEVGIDFYRWHIENEFEGKTSGEIKEYWENPLGVDCTPVGSEKEIICYEREYSNFRGTAIGKFSLEIIKPGDGNSDIEFISTGWHYDDPEVQRKIKAVLTRPSWGDYAMASNSVIQVGKEIPEFHKYEIFGRIHSNIGIRFDGVAHDVVTASQATYWDPSTEQEQEGVWTSVPGKESNVFKAGKEYPVPLLDFNWITANLASMKEAAQEGDNIYLPATEEDGYHLILEDDGNMDIYIVEERGEATYHVISERFEQELALPEEGIVFVEDDVSVEGELNGNKINIGAANLTEGAGDKNIYLEKDIIYNNNDGTDMLVLIAEGDIKIGYESENNLEINAALVAQKGGIGRDYYDPDELKNNSKIKIVGAIISNQAPRFSWARHGHIHDSGYRNQEIHYDLNLSDNAPPFFETKSQYHLSSWEEL